MNTLRRKWDSQKCSKLGVSLLMMVLPFAAVNSEAKGVELAKSSYAMMATHERVAQTSVYYFVVSLNDGSELSIPFSERPVLTCEGINLLLTTTETEVELPNGSVKEFTLTKKDVATGIDELREEGKMERNGNQFLFSNCKAGSSVTVYDRSGRQVAASRVDENGQCQISLQGQPAGMYIVKSESITCKILKK